MADARRRRDAAAIRRTLVDWVRDCHSRSSAPVRVLIVLESFAGWQPDRSFDDARLWLRDDEGVARIAIVGDAGDGSAPC